MRQFTILIFLILLNSKNDCFAQEWSVVPNGITSDNLLFIGRIASINEYYFDIENGIKNEKMERTMTFNRNGLLIKKSEKHFGDNDKKTDIINYHFVNRRLTSYACFKTDKRIDSVSIVYDRKNKVKEKVMFDRTHKISQRITYTYANDSLFTIRKKDADNNIDNMLKITYDPASSSKEIILLNDLLQKVSRNVIITEHKNSGNIYFTKYLYNANDSCISMHSSLIDSNGHIIESMIMNGDKKVDDYRTYKYEKDKVIEEHVFANESEQRISYTYKYDKLNNITDILTFVEGNPVKEMHRDIIYRKTNKEYK